MQAHMTLLGRGPIDEALPLYREALDMLSAQPGAERDRAWVQITMAQALLLADRYEQGIDALLDDAERALVEACDTLGLAHLAMDRVFAAYTVDDASKLEQAAMLELGRSRSIGDVVYEQIALTALGLAAAVYRGDLPRAATLLSRAVTLAWDTGNLLQLGIALQATAAVVTVADDPLRGASLWGAAMTLSPSWPLFARRYGELMDPARAELGDAFAARESAGAGLRPEDAIELALTTLGAMSASAQRTA
jgi:tetratricopeptide (TPR) repeat protein